jgi:SAM-dependent methyltransferase
VTTSAERLELAAYRDGAGWAGGPQAVYDRLAIAALAGLPARLDDSSAVDVGAGTGAATRELVRRGARVVAVDLSAAMLAELSRQTSGRVPTLVGDICRLALPDDEYDVAVAAFVLNHLDDPAAGLRELARVTRPGGHIVASTFGSDDHPVKTAIDGVLLRYGFVHPEWYLTLKRERVPLTGTASAFPSVGVASGLTDVAVEQTDVDLTDLPVEAVIGYRLGLPHIAPFVAAIDPAARPCLDAELADVVGRLLPFRLPMLVLTGRS